MVYLIGVVHRIQYTSDGSALDEIRRFADFLESKALEMKITLIGEELNEEVLRERKATACTALDIAARLKIEHRFCDPTMSERESMGIPSERQIHMRALLDNKGSGKNLREAVRKEREKYFGLRESFWLQRIEDKLGQPIFFVCGADHIAGFRALLMSKGCGTDVLVRDWEEEMKSSASSCS